VENGLHFIELVPLRKADASTIYETHEEERIGDWQYDWNGAATFSGMQARWSSSPFKQEFTSLNFVHCHSHLLQLACVQAANNIRYQTCLHNTNYTLEILSLFTEMG